MTKITTIGTANLRNHYWNPTWDGDEYPQILAEFIKKNHINFLGTQELVQKYRLKLQHELGPDYSIHGAYRYGKIPFIGQFNEANAIITDQPCIETRTTHIATIPFLDHHAQMPRIITSVETPEISMINTHLDYSNRQAQIQQLKRLLKQIKSISEKHEGEPPIITGDFNMEPHEEHFKEFIQELKRLGIKIVTQETATYQPKNQKLDHIFVPDTWNIESVLVPQYQPICDISDHLPIVATLKRK